MNWLRWWVYISKPNKQTTVHSWAFCINNFIVQKFKNMQTIKSLNGFNWWNQRNIHKINIVINKLNWDVLNTYKLWNLQVMIHQYHLNGFHHKYYTRRLTR